MTEEVSKKLFQLLFARHRTMMLRRLWNASSNLGQERQCVYKAIDTATERKRNAGVGRDKSAGLLFQQTFSQLIQGKSTTGRASVKVRSQNNDDGETRNGCRCRRHLLLHWLAKQQPVAVVPAGLCFRLPNGASEWKTKDWRSEAPPPFSKNPRPAKHGPLRRWTVSAAPTTRGEPQPRAHFMHNSDIKPAVSYIHGISASGFLLSHDQGAHV